MHGNYNRKIGGRPVADLTQNGWSGFSAGRMRVTDRKKNYPASYKPPLLLRISNKSPSNTRVPQTFGDALLDKPAKSDEPRNFTEQVRHE